MKQPASISPLPTAQGQAQYPHYSKQSTNTGHGTFVHSIQTASCPVQLLTVFLFYLEHIGQDQTGYSMVTTPNNNGYTSFILHMQQSGLGAPPQPPQRRQADGVLPFGGQGGRNATNHRSSERTPPTRVVTSHSQLLSQRQPPAAPNLKVAQCNPAMGSCNEEQKVVN